MSMQKFRLADSSLIFHLMGLMESNGWTNGSYTVMDAYPTDLEKITKFPCITVQTNAGEGFPVEIGQRSALAITWLIDVFAKGDGQRDDITYLIWDDLRESKLTLYDFNTGFPVDGSNNYTGDYTGISTLGSIIFENVSFQVIGPDEFSDTIAEKHHALIVATGYLSID